MQLDARRCSYKKSPPSWAITCNRALKKARRESRAKQGVSSLYQFPINGTINALVDKGNRMHAGRAIKKLQDDKGLSGNELADILGVVPQQLSRWRNSEDMKLSTIVKLCEALEIEVSDFIDAAK